MNAPTRLPALRATRALAASLRGRPDLMPLFLLATPPLMLVCAGLASAIGHWALLAAAVVLVTLAGAAMWSLGGDRP